MQKVIKETNAINWFQIPVLETNRAKKFYETILDIEMQTQAIAETNEELTFSPFEPADDKIIMPKTKIQAGYFSVFIDTEGNKVGLHAGA